MAARPWKTKRYICITSMNYLLLWQNIKVMVNTHKIFKRILFLIEHHKTTCIFSAICHLQATDRQTNLQGKKCFCLFFIGQYKTMSEQLLVRLTKWNSSREMYLPIQWHTKDNQKHKRFRYKCTCLTSSVHICISSPFSSKKRTKTFNLQENNQKT